MENWLNKITYGNIDQNYVKKIQEKCIGDEVLTVLDQNYGDSLNPPLNASETVKDELNAITEAISNITEKENEEHFRRFKKYDRSLLQTITSVFMEKGIDIEKLAFDINDDIAPTIVKLKQKYQRPRPYQLGEYYKIQLFPFETFSGHSPSYPSGHTLQAYCILNVVGNKYPQTYNFCKRMIDDVAYSRVHLGLHFPSDNDASFIIGQEILKLKSFSEKYKI